MQHECVHCPRPVADAGYLCHECSDDLAKALTFMSDLAGDLEVTITRQDRIGNGTGRPAETPLPYNETASLAADAIRNTLTTWARHIIETRGLASPEELLGQLLANLTAHAVRTCAPGLAPAAFGQAALFARRAREVQLGQLGRAAPLADVARFLAEQVRWIRHQDIAEEAFGELMDAAQAMARACDARPTLTSLGPCMTSGCEAVLRAPHGRKTTRCGDCGAIYDVATRMDQLLTIGGDYLFTARELASILSKRYRRRVPEGTVGAWGSRGLMADRGEIQTRTGKAKVWRLGDAVAIAKRLIPEPDEGKAAAAQAA